MKDNHRQERAKKLLSSSRKRGGKSDMMKSVKKNKSGLSGAAPTAFPVAGQKPAQRMDKRKRYATGGGVDDAMPKKKSGAKTEVNIVIAGKGDQGNTPAQPIPVPVPAGGPPMPPRPSMGAPGMGMPPGGMPMRPGMNKGGRVKEPKTHFDAGAGGGKGRLEKAAAEKRSRQKGKD